MTDLEDTERCVRWWYRAEVKQPPDTMAQLAFEAGCSEAAVSAGIAQVKDWLDQVQPMLDAGLLELGPGKPKGRV